MLRRMTAKQFFEWQLHDLFEPFTDRRADFNAASIVKALWDINRDIKKHPSPFKLEDFVLNFGEREAKKKQSPEDHIRIMMAITEAFTGVTSGR